MSILTEFKSKFALGNLVKFNDENKDSEVAYGFVRSINFWKFDAVNVSASYSIEKCNTMSIVAGVQESTIIRDYGQE